MEETFTKAIDILNLAKQHEIDIILNGDQLKLKIPKGHTIDKNLLEELGANKKLIIDYLSNNSLRLTIVNDDNHKIKSFDRDVVKQIPLSFSQERLWFIDRLEGSVQYNSPVVLRLKGLLNLEALSKALREIVNRHEILRTVYMEENGSVYQRVKTTDDWTLSKIDGGQFKDDPAALDSHIRELTLAPFDLSTDDMFRAELIRLAEDEHILVATTHHIASDASSLPVLIREVSSLYSGFASGKSTALPALPLQYADYALWQRNNLHGVLLDEKLNYWKEKLKDVSALQLPADYDRRTDGSVRGATVLFDLGATLSGRVQALSQNREVTLYMTLLAAFKVLLYRYSGQEDICVGTSVANRPQQELEGLIGFFVNTLALRDHVRGDMSFTELLAEVKKTTLGAYGSQQVSFEKIVETVVKERVAGLSPLFQVMLVLNNTAEVPGLKLGELRLTVENRELTTAKFDLTFFVTESKSGISGAVQYNTDLYSETRIARMADHFKELLQSIVIAPETAVGKLELLTKEEKQELQSFEQSQSSYPKDKTIAALFEEQAQQNPNTIAVAFEEQQLSYKALEERANQLAHYLQSKGVTADTLVPLMTERGLNMLIGILGILKAGGAYVPIDTGFPQDRITYMLEDTKAAVVVTTSTVSDKLPQNTNLTIIELDEEKATLRQQPNTAPETKQTPQSLAYIIYTSGSTGKPKGVEITNSNIADYVYGLEDRIHISESKSFALVSSIATDLGNTVLYGSLLTGGTLHVFTKETVSHIKALHEYFDSHEIDCLKIVPSHWKALTLDDKPLLPKQQIIFGGEALQRTVVETIKETNTKVRIINHYGPTETTIGKLVHEVDQTKEYGATIPIGKPFSNTKTYVLTKELTPCPIGVPGQLYIAGEGLAKGYLNNPELTKEKFIVHPNTKERLYATGDKVQYQQDGNILFIGRVDDQVKIRGYRVEPGEIGRILEQSEQVNQAIVLAKDDKQGNKQLIGYIIPTAGDNYDKQQLQEYLKEQLPDYMIPAHIIALNTFPLTANGKIDRRALPDPEATPTAQYTAARNETEEKLKTIWQDVLELEDISITDDFFELGGHSLLAVRLISQIRKQFGMELPISEVFDYPTAEKLAARLTDEASTDILPPITAEQPRPEYIPLSFSQERLWFIDQLEGSVQYHIPAVLRLKGDLNKVALSYAMETIVDRHEVLRTVIVEDAEGNSYQQIMPSNGWKLEFEDNASVKENKAELAQHVEELAKKPFDLSKDYMLRANLIKVAESEFLLVATLHHIASDGWSRSVLVSELVESYAAYQEGRPPDLPVLAIQYADYAIWQRKYLQGEVLEKKLDYWKSNLEGVAPLQLPADYSRPAIRSSRGAIRGFKIGKELSDQLTDLSHANGATIYMTLLTAFNVLLYRYSGQEDICVGTPVAGRQQEEIEGLIGFFINTLALRNNVQGDTSFTSLLAAVKATTVASFSQQEVPFEKVVDVVVKERDMSRSPLFQVMFSVVNTPDVPELKLGDVSLAIEGQEHTISKFDMVFTLTETPHGLSGAIQYSTDLYKGETIERMINHYINLLNSIVTLPESTIGRLEMLSVSEEEMLLVGFNATDVTYSKETTIIDLFEKQARANPNAIALIYEDREVTYQELNARSNQLARYLQNQGIRAEKLVPICVERSPEMIIGILGILKSGGAYVPIDPEYPADRIGYMLKDTGAKLILSNIPSGEKLNKIGIKIIAIDGDWEQISGQSSADLPEKPESNQLAYVIYTSGSTGRPKGVMIEHGNLLNYLTNSKLDYINDGEGKSGSFVHLSFTFDASLTGMFMPLLSGKYLVLGSKPSLDVFTDPNLEKYAPYDFIKMTPAHLGLLPVNFKSNDGGWLTSKLVLGGEALRIDHFGFILKEGVNVEVINEYGPTEGTIGCSVYSFNTLGEHEFEQNEVPIGKPISNTRLYILSKDQQISPVGVHGELYIGGTQVGRGYLNKPELTQEKFIKDPFSREANARLYRTGDLARWQPDGNIEYLGRIDDQVKIRGYRIELGEIEAILNQSEQVSQGVVLAKKDKQGDKRLVGYVVADQFDRQRIQSYLSEKLPEYMVPAIWVELENIPLTSNGKINRKALPDPELTGKLTEYVEPRNETEIKLASIWQELLNVERVGIYDNFFEIGGHSLLAMRVKSAIRREMEVEIAIRDIFVNPTVATLARHVTEQGPGVLIPEVEALERPARIPLSFSQERLWFIDNLEGSVQYHIPAVIRLKGILNVKALEKALRHVIMRHEILRTVIIEDADGNGYQQIMPISGWKLKYEEKTLYRENIGRLEQHLEELVKVPFNLSEDYMLRANLIKTDEQTHVLAITMHHISSDGWSGSILIEEVATAYNAYVEGREPQMRELKVQYADYAMWQRKYLQGDVLDAKLSYWKEKLFGTSPLQLPTDFSRPAIQSSKGSAFGFKIAQEISAGLKGMSQQNGATLYMTLLSAFNVLLYRYSGQEDICVGTPVAGRSQQETENLIGFFINTLALRSQVEGSKPFTQLLQEVKATTLEAFSHQEVPFEKIVDAVVKTRDMSRSPLFQVLFSLQNTPEVPELRLGDLNVSAVGQEHKTSKFDLAFMIKETSQGIQGTVEYSTGLYKEETIARMTGHYIQLLESVAEKAEEQAGQLNMLSKAEQQTLLQEFNDTKANYPKDKSIVDLIEEQAAKHPNNTAIQFEDKQLTYKELNERSNQIARYLQKQGVTAETLVPICIERGPDMVTGILGILKAGGTYVPVDPEYPQDRITYMLEDTKAKLVLSSKESKAKIGKGIKVIALDTEQAIDKENSDNLKTQIHPNQLAYVIYTSGSTGKPKGVMIEHGSVINLLISIAKEVKFTEKSSFLSVTTYSFDICYLELYMPLIYGSKLIIVSRQTAADGYELAANIANNRPTHMQGTPSTWQLLTDAGWTNREHINMLIGGEAVKEGIKDELTRIGKVWNVYGPTETTIWSTIKQLKTDEKVTIGKPIQNTTIYILNQDNQLTPTGVAGELCIGGTGLARGYYNKPKLTAEKFIKNPFSKEKGARLYRTGDLARWLPDGNIEHLGRIDDQVKIRGYRIELGEIEAILNQNEEISQGVVLAKDDKQGNKRLVGYVVADQFDKQKTQSYLSEKLPEYMVPQLWVELSSIPLTPNGKTDRKALPDPELSDMTTEYVAPRNAAEQALAHIWQELLGIEKAGIYDNFFELGGHSLLAMQIISQIRKKLHAAIAIKDLFVYPTIATLASHLHGQKRDKFKSLVPIKSMGSKPPLYIICGAGGTVFKFRDFVSLLDKDQPVYGLQQAVSNNDPEDFPDTIEGIAARYIEEILLENPEGPYALSGHCLGGTIAFEMVSQFEAMGKKVSLLAMFDANVKERRTVIPATIKNFYHIPLIVKRLMVKIPTKIKFELFLLTKHPKQALQYKIRKIRSWFVSNETKPDNIDQALFDKLTKKSEKALNSYNIKPYDVDIILFNAMQHFYFVDAVNKVIYKELNVNYARKYAWKRYARSIKNYQVKGEHSTMFDSRNAEEFSRILQQHLDGNVTIEQDTSI